MGKLLRSVAPDLQDVNRYRYARQFSGLEELVEALTFETYLRTARLMSPQEVQQRVNDLIASAAIAESTSTAPAPIDSSQQPLAILLDSDDYIGGVFDLTGEIMRFATANRQFVLPPSRRQKQELSQRDDATDVSVLRDMQRLESMFRTLPAPTRFHDEHYRKKLNTKMQTLLASVHKVEVLAYGLTVRGSERPDGWVPDLEVEARREEDG